jgi:hypothetical protein
MKLPARPPVSQGDSTKVQEIYFHTSCSKPISVSDIFVGAVVVVDFTGDEPGKITCDEEQPPIDVCTGLPSVYCLLPEWFDEFNSNEANCCYSSRALLFGVKYYCKCWPTWRLLYCTSSIDSAKQKLAGAPSPYPSEDLPKSRSDLSWERIKNPPSTTSHCLMWELPKVSISISFIFFKLE